MQKGESIRREIEEKPGEMEKMLRGPMFDLSPEDKAAGEDEPGTGGSSGKRSRKNHRESRDQS